MAPFRLALAQYPLDPLEDWDDVEGKLDYWVGQAVEDGADLAVFPEYAAMEVAHLDGAAASGDLARSLDAVSDRLARLDDLHAALARRHQVALVAGSAPWRKASGKVVNVARLFLPDGTRHVQEKRIMTRFEREKWTIENGEGLAVFAVGPARIGIAICYDVEFPLVVRPFVEAGANLILAPSATEKFAGSTRVHTGARARALENQCYVGVSQLVGDAPWCAACDVSAGKAAVYAPSDLGFPETGVVAEGEFGEPQWVIAELDFDKVEAVRREGAVFNHAHWGEQPFGERAGRG